MGYQVLFFADKGFAELDFFLEVAGKDVLKVFGGFELLGSY